MVRGPGRGCVLSDVCTSSGPMLLCAGVRGRRREGAAGAAPLQECSRSPASLPSCQLGQGLQGHCLRGRGRREADRWQKIQSPVGVQWPYSPPSGTLFLGCCFRAGTGPTVCHSNVRGLLAELARHGQRPGSKHTCADSAPPSCLSHLGSVLPGKSVWIQHTYRRWGLYLFLAAKIALCITM